MTDTQKKFVESLRDLLAFDALTSQWLMPLDPLLNHCYHSRFRMSPESVARYLVFDGAFPDGQSWQTPDEFYLRSRTKAEHLAQLGYFCNHHEADAPTGYG